VETLSTVVGFIFSFKACVMLPAVILVAALAIRMNVGQAALSALRLGVGFTGIFIAFGFFVQQIAPAVMSVIVLVTRSNVFRAVIMGIPIVIGYLLISTHLAPLYTVLAAKVGAVTAQGCAGDITAFTDGGNPVRFWFFEMFRGKLIALLLIPLVLALMYYSWRRNRKEIEE
jgi:galactitol-specific phosphotransferase system IIC component